MNFSKYGSHGFTISYSPNIKKIKGFFDLKHDRNRFVFKKLEFQLLLIIASQKKHYAVYFKFS